MVEFVFTVLIVVIIVAVLLLVIASARVMGCCLCKSTVISNDNETYQSDISVTQEEHIANSACYGDSVIENNKNHIISLHPTQMV